MQTTELIIYLFSGMFFVMGLVLVWFILISHKLNNATNQWTTVPGVITRSEIKKEEYQYSYDTDEFNSSKGVSYKIVIEYSYIIDKVEYTSNKIYALKLNNYFLYKSDITYLLNKFPSSKKVDVYINPTKKLDSVLVNHIRIFDKIIYAFLFIMIAVLLIAFRLGIVGVISQ